mmetsp:Transcript_19368/g.68546  ORF Transcript_19368/g.68546 Transcript_19368/m.68546 type:complete len:201 (-) Transcript_19368:684-1286(-)
MVALLMTYWLMSRNGQNTPISAKSTDTTGGRDEAPTRSVAHSWLPPWKSPCASVHANVGSEMSIDAWKASQLVAANSVSIASAIVPAYRSGGARRVTIAHFFFMSSTPSTHCARFLPRSQSTCLSHGMSSSSRFCHSAACVSASSRNTARSSTAWSVGAPAGSGGGGPQHWLPSMCESVRHSPISSISTLNVPAATSPSA